MEDWNALQEHEQTWTRAQALFKDASQKMQRHAAQEADAHGYGGAYNAQTEDDASIASTIADMNIKRAESLEAFSKLSQSNHTTQSRNMQLEHENAALKAQLAQAQMHTTNAAMAPPRMMSPPQFQ